MKRIDKDLVLIWELEKKYLTNRSLDINYWSQNPFLLNSDRPKMNKNEVERKGNLTQSMSRVLLVYVLFIIAGIIA